MHKNYLTAIFLSFIILLFNNCNSSNKLPKNKTINITDSSEGLKDYYKDYFPIGVAVSSQVLKDPAEMKLIKSKLQN